MTPSITTSFIACTGAAASFEVEATGVCGVAALVPGSGVEGPDDAGDGLLSTNVLFLNPPCGLTALPPAYAGAGTGAGAGVDEPESGWEGLARPGAIQVALRWGIW